LSLGWNAQDVKDFEDVGFSQLKQVDMYFLNIRKLRISRMLVFKEVQVLDRMHTLDTRILRISRMLA
jgi:hypothetical protein